MAATLPQTLTIGGLELDTPVLSAPVAGFTDRLYRKILRDFGGCGLIFTEMVSAGGWIQGRIPPARLDGVVVEPRPLGVQLWDRDPEMIRVAARRLREEYDVSLIDLNFGCPKKRIMGKQGAGAKLLRDPETVGRMVAAAVDGASGIPVTIKLRLGASLENQTAVAVAQSAESNGACAVTVHGRTADQAYNKPCNYDGIARVVDAVDVPVIANGDITDFKKALQVLDRTGASGVMVARSALTRPWVLREITAALRGDPIPESPTPAEQLGRLLEHHRDMVEVHGDPRGTVLMRKFACRYLSGVVGGADFRRQISVAKNAEDFRNIVDHFFGENAVGYC